MGKLFRKHFGGRRRRNFNNPFCQLRDLSCGKKAIIRSLGEHEDLRGRLCALGLTPGTVVEICGQTGCFRLRLRGCSLALDAELAGSVTCEEMYEE